MKIQTRYNGEIEIEKDMIIQFPSGIPGFPDDKEYFIIGLDEGSSFSILQSVQSADLGFVIVDPFTFYKEYEFDIPEYITHQLKIERENEVIIYSIVTLSHSLETSTINLQSPVIINSKKKLGRQLILNTDKYHTKHPLNKKTGQEG